MNALRITISLVIGLTSCFTIACAEKNLLVDDDNIAWGPKTESGIRIGLSIEGNPSSCYAGAQIRPIFHFRNDSDELLDFDHPRMVQVVWTKFIITDQEGNEVDWTILQDGPWIAGHFGATLEPGNMAEVPGSAIRIGGSDFNDGPGNFQAVIHAKPGQHLKIAFELDNFQRLIPKAKTGEFAMKVVDPIEKANRDIAELGDWVSGERFQSKQYSNLAALLMSLEPDPRIELMRGWCKQYDTQVLTLSRMLFVNAEEGQHIRAPHLGAPVFLDGTTDEWPQHPITLSDGIPFLVVRGYDLAGQAEPARVYMNFCLSRHGWTKESFVQFSDWHYKSALKKLLTQRKWSAADEQFLTNQIPAEVESE